MPSFTARAEFDRLTHVRAHRPGLELWPGALDPESNLFDAPVPPAQAAREHERMTDALAAAGVEVHLLADDLAAAGELDALVAEYVDVPEGVDESQRLSSANQSAKRSGDADAAAATVEFDAREKLELVLSRARLTEANDRTSVELRQPISNTLFQSDTVVVGDEGPVLCEMGEPIRQDELPIVRRAWEGLGAEFTHEMSRPLEGGEFLPADEFALLGVSAEIDGEEEVIRTTYDAGREFLDAGAVGFEEVGLVRAPLAADRRHREKHGIGSRVLHLLGWCNLAAEGLAVTDPELAESAAVDVFRKTSDGYEFDRSTSTLAYLRQRGYDIVEMGPEERWAANFLTVDDGVVVPMHRTDEDGNYDPDLNGTIERLKERGVEVLPDGEGIPEGVLTSGAGGINCMTVPLERR
ncbi:arginine deiminase family protein [Halolamina rubra]|uniref:arginine deiminase family protein n=1 Tax=Halolamina rubra TaxID=1380430 RepID=UPI00067968A6|nr:arginine deiminase family protein [Halolamina rubra]